MVWVCLALAGVSLAISLPLGALLVGSGYRWGWIDPIGGEAHKRHERAVPNTGGIAIFIAVAMPMTAALLSVWLLSPAWWHQWLPAVGVHLDGLKSSSSMGGGVLSAMGLLHLLGLWDDRRPLGPYVKLAGQLLIALGLVTLCDMRVLEFLAHQGAWGQVLTLVLSLLWIVVIINAFNFLDNMDGLAGGVAAIIAGLYLAATLLAGQWFVAALTALLLGALVGFLVFNFPPAKLFMGDGGSLVVGLLLAVISIRTTYFAPEGDPDIVLRVPGHWYGALMPLMVMAVPLYDFVSVVVIRLAQGRSPFRGDQSHFSHRLVAGGLTRRRAVVVIWLCTLATGLGGVMLGFLDHWQAMIAAAQSATVLVLLAVLETSRGLFLGR
ncbi:MAG TPA: MraY family glycosyltransferase [Phycisphaeraceae bacterium]